MVLAVQLSLNLTRLIRQMISVIRPEACKLAT